MRLPVVHDRRLAPVLVLAALAAGAADARAQSLRGSPESVERMYREARRESLTFHETPGEVAVAARSGALVRLTATRDVALGSVSFPYVTPATRTFVEQLGAQHRKACGKPLIVTSAARPTSRQPVNSVAESVHPTGMAIDLRKPTGRCLKWLRASLLELERAGVIEATEEFRPPHFHVAVFPTSYTRYAALQSTDDDATRVVATASAKAAPPKAAKASKGANAPKAAKAPVRVAAATVARAPSAASAPSARTATAREKARVAKERAAATRVAAAARRYRVRDGDTLWDIARANNVTVQQLVAANRLSKPVIRPGQRLVLPRAATGRSAGDEAVGQ